MSEDIRALTAQLAEDPESLAFLPLGEALRRRGQLAAAARVARSGLSRYPELADGHDLFARILSDQGDLENAFDEWSIAVRLAPSHVGANKGIAFLYYRAGDLASAVRHLESAAAAAPDDPGIAAALDRVRASLTAPATPDQPAAAATRPVPVSDAAVFAGLDGASEDLLLVDLLGLRLGGGIRRPDGADVGDAVAADLAGVSREATRAARLLGLGTWQSVAAETPDAQLHLVAPTDGTVLLIIREPAVPPGRVAVMAERAARAARTWLEQLG